MVGKIKIDGEWAKVDADEVDRAIDNTAAGVCAVCGSPIQTRVMAQTGEGDSVSLGFCSLRHVKEWAAECPPDEEE